MFRLSTADEYEASSTQGTRHLFALDNFQFRDTLDDTGRLHPYVVESAGGDDTFYEIDPASMYELMARYLAGVYEIVEYDLENSPAHDALLDLLEFATARARTGDGDFTLHEIEAEAAPDDEELEEEEEEESEDWRG
jgi:hypothetical protein